MDDYSAIPDSALTFDFIYQQILQYYSLLFPVMKNRIDLSNGTAVKDNWQPILDRINPLLFEASGYMPVSRDMSDGKRSLLERWLKLNSNSPGIGADLDPQSL